MQVEGPFLVAGSYKELLFGMSASTGRVIWTFNAGNFINSQLVANGRAFLWSPTGWIFAIAVKDGRLLWRHQTTQYRLGQPAWAAVMAELVVSGSSLFALDMDDTLHVLDVRDGVETSRFTFPEPLVPTVLPLNRGNVMLATESGNLQLIKVG
jgi:outer membrane protein assembly factor BamB